MPSSVIQRMVYDPKTRTLEITFRGARGRYRYFEVPLEVWGAFRFAPSKGTYLNGPFKDLDFHYEKLDPSVRPLRGEYWGDATSSA